MLWQQTSWKTKLLKKKAAEDAVHSQFNTEFYNSSQHKLFIQVLQETAGWPPLTHESRTAGFNSSNYTLQSVRTLHACAVLLWELMSSGVKPEERSGGWRHSENPALSYHLTGEPPDPQPGLHHRIHLTTQILLRSSTHSPQSHGRTLSDIVQPSVDAVIMDSWCT